MEVNLVSQKKKYKQNLVWFVGFTDGKIVFTLLAKVVAFHVKLTTVDVWSFGLEFISKSTL